MPTPDGHNWQGGAIAASGTVRDYLASLVRTVVPVLVGLVLSALLRAGVDVDPGALTVVVDGVLVGGYYAAVRLAESRYPVLGLLLGWRATPHYDDQ